MSSVFFFFFFFSRTEGSQVNLESAYCHLLSLEFSLNIIFTTYEKENPKLAFYTVKVSVLASC